jgi:nucleotide-binding universal stress UspA family protein
MISLKQIVVPTDFSDCSDRALTYGRELAKAFGASLHLLHVVHDPYSQPWAAEAFPTPLGDLLEQWQGQARARLANLVPEPDRETTRLAVVVGSPFFEIVRYAKEQQIDLIVIGTHGRTGLARVLLGSVAQRVIGTAPCPVLAVRGT